MALKDFVVDKDSALEKNESNQIRRQLRLSDRWIVKGKFVHMYSQEYSDDYPNIPDIPEKNGNNKLGHSRILITRRPEHSHKCPVCGEKCKILCYEKRTYRHIDDLGCSCELMVNLPKFKCDCCGGTPQAIFLASFKRKSYTRIFAYCVIDKLKHKSKTAVSLEMGVSTDVIDSILKECTYPAYINQDLSHVTGVFVDETQFGHGQDYLSVFIDQNHKVIFTCHGHDSSVLELFSEHLQIHGGDPESIRFFSADMSKAYESGVMKNFPNALLIFDRFHLMKSVNDALNDVRKRLLRRNKDQSLKSIKYVVLTDQMNHDDRQADLLRNIRMNLPELALAFDMKEAFSHIIKTKDPSLMENLLNSWIDWVNDCGPDEFKKKAKIFREKMERITSWTRYPVSNSVCEGINKNVQDIRRQACGYKNIHNMFDMIFLRQGNLTYTF